MIDNQSDLDRAERRIVHLMRENDYLLKEARRLLAESRQVRRENQLLIDELAKGRER